MESFPRSRPGRIGKPFCCKIARQEKSLASGGVRAYVHINTVFLHMLTRRQREVLEFIRQQQRLQGIAPSTQEIQSHFGFASPTAVVGHISALERKGLLKRQPGKARSLVLTEDLQKKETLEIPIYGMIPAGLPADQQQEANGCISVDVESIQLPRSARVFALKVKGDSMINAGILSGDTVVLEFKEAKHDDIVAALIDGETTLKRLILRRGQPFLKAENPDYPDLIPARELVIQGVMVALFRTVKRT